MAKYLGRRLVDCSKLLYECDHLKSYQRRTEHWSILWTTANNYIDIKHWDQNRITGTIYNHTHFRAPITCGMVPFIENTLYLVCQIKAREDMVNDYLEKQLKDLL